MIIDKIDNLPKVFNEINDFFGLDNISLLTDVVDSDAIMGSIFVESAWDETLRDMYHTIYVKDGELQYGIYYKIIYHRLFKFIDNVGIELTPLSRTIILLLHEFGHINRVNTMYMFNQERTMNLIDDVTDRILDDKLFTQYAIQAMQTDGIDLVYTMKSTEMYADAFAMKWFMPIWNRINESL